MEAREPHRREACALLLRCRLGPRAEDCHDLVGGSSAGELITHVTVVQEFCDGSKGAEVSLKLIFRNNEKDNELHGRVIERIELDPGTGAAKSGHNFVQPVR